MLPERGAAAGTAQPLLVQGPCLHRAGSARALVRPHTSSSTGQGRGSWKSLWKGSEGSMPFSPTPVHDSSSGSSQPHREGFVGGSATAKRSYFPCPSRTKVTSPRCLPPPKRAPPHPACQQTHPGSRLTWGGLSVRSRPSPSIARSGLTSSGAERTRWGSAGGPRRVPEGSSWGRAAPAPSGPGDGWPLAPSLSPPTPVRVSRSGQAEAAGTASPAAGAPLCPAAGCGGSAPDTPGSGSCMAGAGRWAHPLTARAPRGSGSRHGKPEGIRAAAAGAARAALPPGGDGDGGGGSDGGSSSSIPAPGEAPSPPGSAGSAGGRLPPPLPPPHTPPHPPYKGCCPLPSAPRRPRPHARRRPPGPG